MLERPELCVTVKFRIQEGGRIAGVVLGKTLVLARPWRGAGVPAVINSWAEGRLKVTLQGGESEVLRAVCRACGATVSYDKLKRCTAAQICTNETL